MVLSWKGRSVVLLLVVLHLVHQSVIREILRVGWHSTTAIIVGVVLVSKCCANPSFLFWKHRANSWNAIKQECFKHLGLVRISFPSFIYIYWIKDMTMFQ